MNRTSSRIIYCLGITGLIMIAFLGWELPARESNESIAVGSESLDRPRLFAENTMNNAHLRSIRLGTWNIDRGGNWTRVTNSLHSLELDLALLQEVDWNASRSGRLDETADLAHRFRLNASFGIEFEELGQESLGNERAYTGQATLTRLPILKSRVLRFASQTSFWQPRSWMASHVPFLQRREGGRIALITELIFAGRPLVVYNVHLESRSFGRLQLRQIDEVLADFKEHYAANTFCILGGDLNSKYLPSIYLHRLQAAGFQSATGNKIERSHVVAMALDWLFVRGSLAIEEGAVNRHVAGSDHYPVIARLHAH